MCFGKQMKQRSSESSPCKGEVYIKDKIKKKKKKTKKDIRKEGQEEGNK
jgi:hypothetical protein